MGPQQAAACLSSLAGGYGPAREQPLQLTVAKITQQHARAPLISVHVRAVRQLVVLTWS